MNRKERIYYEIGVAAIGIFLGVALFCLQVITGAHAEEVETWNCWVMCQPGSEVLIRDKPKKRAEIVGAAASGSRMRTDYEERNGYLHLVDVNNETGDGWIYAGYIVYEEPDATETEMLIDSRGRVACRRWIGGKRKSWAKPGSSVTVYMTADGWAVTDRGYIRCEYLGVP